MQKNEITENLRKVDQYVTNNFASLLVGGKFELKIIGKSALYLAGLEDTVGTVDIDSLGIDGKLPLSHLKIVENLRDEFGRDNLKVHGFYLEFVAPAIVLLPQQQTWMPLESGYTSLSAGYLETHYVAASKLFSAFSSPPRKKDKQDIVSILDQKKAGFQKVLNIADEIFDVYSMDARSSRFPAVYQYIMDVLMDQYGPAQLKFEPEVDG